MKHKDNSNTTDIILFFPTKILDKSGFSNSGSNIHAREITLNMPSEQTNLALICNHADEEVKNKIFTRECNIVQNNGFRKTLNLIYGVLFCLWYVISLDSPVFYVRDDISFLFPMVISKTTSASVVVEVNDIAKEKAAVTDFQSDRPIYDHLKYISDLITYESVKFSDYVITVTPKIKNKLVSEYHVPSDRIANINNGANVELFHPIDKNEAKERLELDKNTNYVCFVGSFKAWHGVENIIRSIPIVENGPERPHYLLIGDGPLRERCEQKATDLGVRDSVTFTGAVSYEMVPWYICASDFCLAPFTKERNSEIGLSPLKIYEYLACGRATISTAISNLEFLEEEGFGLLIDEPNPKQISDAVFKLMNCSEIRERAANNGHQYIEQNHSWEANAAKIRGICKDL